jgi:alpha-glucosidase (family GH31 glycosyl hydrolase)
MWADIDYMDDYKIFTISESRYGGLADKVTQLHANNVTFVPIMDAGVAVRQASDNYMALELGKTMDIFIKQANGKDPLTAGVWCGNAYFPDLFTD